MVAHPNRSKIRKRSIKPSEDHETITHKNYHNKFDINIQLRPIKLVWWDGPDEIYVLPTDSSHRYLCNFMKQFRPHLDKEKDEEAAHNRYKVGDVCFFRDYNNRNLTKWLRGIVVAEPKISPDNSSLWNKKYRCIQDEILGIMDISNFVYRIRALDYGFKVYKSSRNMRPVLNLDLFRSFAPWARRCKLANIYPSPADTDTTGGFSTVSIYAMERWLRERIIDYRSLSSFFIPRKTKLWPAVTSSEIRITLFHRTELPQSSIIWDNQRIIDYKIDCLNLDLLIHGYVSDVDPRTGRSTYSFLEDQILYLLPPPKKVDSDNDNDWSK